MPRRSRLDNWGLTLWTDRGGVFGRLDEIPGRAFLPNVSGMPVAARFDSQMPARLRPTAPIAADAILVGDPGRALMLAQELLRQPKMSNHARGLWGYSGETEAGHGLTVQATGMGGPSASVVLADLAELGVRRAIRIGTCTALDARSALGELVLVEEAHHLGEPGAGARPDEELTIALEGELRESARRGAVASLDTLHRPGVDAQPGAGEVADMQTAVLLERGRALRVPLAAVLVVAAGANDETLDDEALNETATRAGRAAVSVLSG
jgi:nucleoside phosphorylase